MNCPKCKDVLLAPLIVDEVEVDRCSRCQGFWFDKAELHDLLARETARVGRLLDDDEGAATYRRGACPRDGRTLLRVASTRNRQVFLDVCSTCQGVWLDGGEFEKLRKREGNVRFVDLL